MDHKALIQAVLNYILQNKAVSYAEIEYFFQKNNFDYRGNLEICSPINENVVLWSSWNEEAATILNELKRANLIHQEPTSPLTYLIDGKSLNYPRVTSGRQYKTPHWLPVVFQPGPGE